MKRLDLRRRLDALMAAIRPKGSFAAKVDALTPAQRAIYDYWRHQTTEWHRQHPSGEAFRLLIEDGIAPPALRPDVRAILFEPSPTIPANASLEDAAEIFRRYAEGS